MPVTRSDTDRPDRPDGPPPPTVAPWRDRLHEIIFEADTPAGKAFDIALLVLIAASILAVMLETVAEYREAHGLLLYRLEWAFTILFTIEYGLRLMCVRRPLRYAFSFYGIVDVLAILPTYMELLPFVGETRSLLLIRSLRLLRVFRVLKLVRYVGEARELQTALAASRAKIFVFLWTVMIVVLIVGAAMYLIEGPEHGFTSIPQSTYWAVVTMTTVGYGDIAPETVPGKFLASLLMITGYGIIAVPTGIVSAEMAQVRGRPTEVRTRSCSECTAEGHLADAVYCRRCGRNLDGESRPADAPE